MEHFVGRVRELSMLETAYADPPFAFIPVYGRRRVGKSELILRFMHNKPSLYFLGKQATAELQIQEFLQTAASVLQQPLLAKATVTQWKEALRLVGEHIPTGKKFVLCLDEFQWMAQASPELPSVLQELIDREWKRTRKIVLILCGSYLGFMEREVLGEKSPLFGRRTAQILLKPFAYHEAAQFHPQWGWPDRAKAYFLCGGIPHYLLCLSDDYSIAKNIERNFLNEYAPLFREPDFLLREELREVQTYYAILMAMAAGASVGKMIASQAGLDERKLHYYIQHLCELGYVRRKYPLTGSRPTPRHVRFVLDDPLLRFWFRFVYPHTSAIAQMGPKAAARVLIAPHFDAYCGLRFEALCREALPLLYQREGIHTAFEVGEYWDAHTQIDVLGYRNGEGIDVGECKWGSVRTGALVMAAVQEKMARYPNPHNLTVRGRIFSRLPIRKERAEKKMRLHTLEELYELG